MVSKKIKKVFYFGSVVCFLGFCLLCLTGCEATSQACKKTADEVVKADQWFREKFW